METRARICYAPLVELFLDAETYIGLATLTAMEIVLGIDNIVFISIVTARLPKEEQPRARSIGISLALVMRLALLFAISWVMGLTTPLFSVLSLEFSGRSLILVGGGLFLLAKATYEIYEKVEHVDDQGRHVSARASFGFTLVQIVLLDIVFSLDSVITAVGMAQHLAVMVVAMIIAVGVMLLASGAVSDFVHRHPSVQVLALSFLILIGVMLTVEGMGQHVAKGYIYFAMAFSLAVELLNVRMRKRRASKPAST